MCATCDRGYSLDSTGCPFNLRGEHTAGRAGEDSWEVRACFLCRAGPRVNAVCCPFLSLSLLPTLSFLFAFSYLISVIIHFSCVLKWSSKKCLKGWATGWQMIVQCMSDDVRGQDFMLMDNWFRLLQIKSGSFANGKRTCGGFILPGFGLKWDLRDSWEYRSCSDPHLLSSIYCWIFDQFHGHFFGQLSGVNGSCKIIQRGWSLPH